jgi:chromosomal replication initiation ATPase DnaA
MNKLDYILNRVFNYFELNPETAFMKTRKSEIVKARQYFYFFARKHTGKSLNQIATFLKQDHATVLHSIRKIKGFIQIGYTPELQIVSELSDMFENMRIEND